MPTIIAYINLFSVNQPIYYSNGDTPQLVATVPVDTVGITVAQLCNKYGSNVAHLFGEDGFLSPIVESIYDFSKTQYNNFDLKVEVNK